MDNCDSALYKLRFIKFQRLKSRLDYYKDLKYEALKNFDFILASDYRFKELEIIKLMDNFQEIK